jgi:hypothetical protein
MLWKKGNNNSLPAAEVILSNRHDNCSSTQPRWVPVMDGLGVIIVRMSCPQSGKLLHAKKEVDDDDTSIFWQG